MIRIARPPDALGIQGCMAAAFGAYRDAYTPPAFADTVPAAAGILERIRTMHVLVASPRDDLERVIGTVAAHVDKGHAHLRGMAVDPLFQGQGVARTLLAEMESELLAHGVDRVTLDVTAPLLGAQQLYESNGFRRTGRVKPFFGMTVYEYEKRLDVPGVSTFKEATHGQL